MTSEFDISGFRELVQNHWRHHGNCHHLNWAFFEREDNVTQISVAPVYQEIFGGHEDGKLVWTGFEFDLTGFVAEPGIEITESGVVSFCEGSNDPLLAVIGSFNGQSFVMRLNLEPIKNTAPVERIDIFTNEVRIIEREKHD